jgi:hypothetical protein
MHALRHQRVGGVALQPADLDRLALGRLAHAGLLAQRLGRADAGAHAAEDVLVEDRLGRRLGRAGRDLADEERDVDRGRAGGDAGRIVAEIAAVAATCASWASKGGSTSAKFAAMRSGGRRPATMPGVCGVADIGFSLLRRFPQGWHRSVFLSIGKIAAPDHCRHPAHCVRTLCISWAAPRILPRRASFAIAGAAEPCLILRRNRRRPPCSPPSPRPRPDEAARAAARPRPRRGGGDRPRRPQPARPSAPVRLGQGDAAPRRRNRARGGAAQHRRRHDRRRRLRLVARRGRGRGADRHDPGRRAHLPRRRRRGPGRDPPDRRPRRAAALAAAGNHPLRRRASAPQPRHRHGRGCRGAGAGIGGARPARHGRDPRPRLSQRPVAHPPGRAPRLCRRAALRGRSRPGLRRGRHARRRPGAGDAGARRPRCRGPAGGRAPPPPAQPRASIPPPRPGTACS